ncbi:MAG: N(2)-acetyl-L-2,4-diaminobutanoate deacetylase DoeB [Mesorhizobium sp.]
MKPNPISPTIPLDAQGVHHGHLRLPYSRDDSAWGSVMIPICIIRNGTGPTALLTGGNHGDEYEGPLALFDLARRTNAKEVSGAIIIIPAMNYPAFRAGTRTSPIDKGNMNRTFPGAPDGTVTQKIADFFQRELLPRADIVLDFHSGGKTLDFVPFCAGHILPDKQKEAGTFAAVKAFGAPYSMRMTEIDAVGMYDTAAEEMGKIFVTTELGGGGTSRAETVRIARRGVSNVLKHVGIIGGAIDATSTQWLDMPEGCFSFAENDGMVETIMDLGEPVSAGNVIARIWPTDRTGLAPVEIVARISGILAARHFPGLIKAGDCAAVVATISKK